MDNWFVWVVAGTVVFPPSLRPTSPCRLNTGGSENKKCLGYKQKVKETKAA
jgi:hypothetical protein